jgi:UDP-hydrolysing UDP-N-acetyl-D-glucosamine 2-epimerase
MSKAPTQPPEERSSAHATAEGAPGPAFGGAPANRRRICVVTGSRADYGLLYWLLRDLRDDAAFDLQLLVTGMHLSPEFGLTVDQITADGFTVIERVESLVSSDTPVGIGKAIGLGVIGCADAFARLRPDLVVVLGDRFEIFAAAQAALVHRLPIAHLHGGEVTEGAIDEMFRHALTKMAHLHFTAAEPYRQRVIQLGEDPARVWNVGAVGLDHIERTPLLDRATLERSLGMPLEPPVFVVTQHPATIEANAAGAAVDALLEALQAFPQARIVFTAANADADGRAGREAIARFVATHADRAIAVTNLGQVRYLSLVKLADAVLGNSSSGLIEAPALGTPTVNIGRRQHGRLRASSVVDCPANATAIQQSLTTVLSAAFQAGLHPITTPYGVGGASRRVRDILRTVDLTDLFGKPFFDWPLSDLIPESAPK